MTLPVWQGLAAQESAGDILVLASPTVTVTDKATGANATLFEDRDGAVGLGNPFTAGADGSIEFYVAPGRYKVEATKGGNTATWDNQLIGTVHGAEHLWKLATVEIITVAGNASSPTDDAYSADLGGNLSADDTFIGRVANRNETTTPTFENTGGTPGALTITAYDGRPLWPGALEGDHRFQYEAGTSPETWLVLDPNDMGVVDPEHATDSATDTYVSDTNTTPPADGVKITRDFQSANTIISPTLDATLLTTRDGSDLWAGAVSGPHELQRDQTADTYLVLEPRPTAANVNDAPVARDANGRAKFADPSAAQDVVTKAHFDAKQQWRAKAWVKFNGTGTVAIDDSYNVDSITDGGTGVYKVNWTTDFASAEYAMVAFSNTVHVWADTTTTDFTAGASCSINTLNTSHADTDASDVMVIAFGDQ